MNTEKPAIFDGQPNDDGEPVFNAPWQAKTFAMTLNLHAQGMFSWQEWTHFFSDEIRRFEESGGNVDADQYYHLWQTALETLVVQKLQT